MASKIIAVVMCLVVVVQVVFGQAAPSCEAQAASLKSQVALAANQGGTEVSLARLNIQANINAARQTINAQIAALKTKINATPSPCKASANLALAQLNNNALNLCRETADLSALNLQLAQLNQLKGSAGKVCGTCGQLYPLPGQAEDLNGCVVSGLTSVQSQAEGLQAAISSGAVNVQGKSALCVEDAQKAQLGVVSKASADFDACVAGV